MRKQTATSRAAGWIEHFRDKGFRIHAQKFRGLIQVTKEKLLPLLYSQYYFSFKKSILMLPARTVEMLLKSVVSIKFQRKASKPVGVLHLK